MSLSYTPYVGVLLLNGLISAIIGFILLGNRNIPGKTLLLLIIAAAAEVSLASAFEVASLEIPAKVFWAKIEYLGNQSGPVLFLMFALAYTHQEEWLTGRNVLLIWLIPLTTMLLAATNEWHKLIWTSFTHSPDNSAILIYGHGLWFYVCLVFGYLAILAGCIILIRASRRSPQLYRRQIGILFIAAVIPGLGNLIYLTGFTPVAGLDTAPISFSVAILILSFGVYRFRLLDLVPIGRGTLIEHMGDGVMVVDLQDRIADINLAAQKLIGVTSQAAIGQPVGTVLNSWPALVQRFRDVAQIQTVVRLDNDPPRYLDLNISLLYDHRHHYTGRLIVFRDITKRRQTEEALARNIEELKIINRISLAITSGLDMERVLKTLLEQCKEVASIDIFYVALYDETNSLINIPLYYDDGKYETGPSRDISESPGLIGTIIKDRKTLYLHDTINPITRPLKRKTKELTGPIMSYVGIPLTLRERVIGVMAIENHHPNAYTEDQIHLLERIAVQAAIAVENARLYAEEQRLAIIDELTGIYNYRGLVELGRREVDRACRFKHPLSAVFFDIDNVRKFNNTYSHGTGNIILQTVAQRCRSILRSVDVFARYGGDEFTILLPETTLNEAEDVAKRIVEEVANTKIATSYGELGVTISVGVTTLKENIPDLFDLIERANRGERQAKQRNEGKIITEV
jgi:diguanylate cyclase (GGDEF)-like protein/PAS domain S-box-containing protein